MAERLPLEAVENDDLVDYEEDLLKLSLPDNEQTWLYSLPGTDPNSIVDLSEFLLINSTFSPRSRLSLHTEDDNTRSHTINTRTFTRQRRQYSNGIGKKQIICPNKNINPGGSGRIQEKATVLITHAPVVQIPKVEDCANETIDKIEKNTSDIVELQKIARTPELNTNNCMNNNLSAKPSSTSLSLDASNHTLLFDVSVPKGLMDGTISTSLSDSIQFSEQSYVPFMPKSVSTPSRKIQSEGKKKYETNFTPDKSGFDYNINNNTIESLANNTFSVSVINNENNDQNDHINLNVTHIISTSKMEFENPANVNEEIKHENILQNTFVLEGSTEEDDMLNANDPLLLPFNYESPLSMKNDANSKLDELINIPYETVRDSTVIIKSKDIDSEQDSCYSSSSNLRSLGDVCAMSQLQPQKSCDLDSILKKARSEEMLCSAQDIECEVDPEKQHGSALNLSPHKTNQLIVLL